MNNYNTRANNFVEGNLEGDVLNLEFGSEVVELICDDKSEDEFFQQYYSPCVGEPTKHGRLLDMSIMLVSLSLAWFV